MNIAFYILLTMAAVYVIFHIGDFFRWWYDKILIVPKTIWNLVKKLFGR